MKNDKNQVFFSRHSLRRIKLYGIPKDLIIEHFIRFDLPVGKYEEIRDISGYKYPIKVVYKVIERNRIIIVTAYPVKRGKNENLL